MGSLTVKNSTKFGKANASDQQIGGIECTDNGKCQRLKNKRNARIKNVSPMKPGLAKIIEMVRSSRNFESPETDLYIAVDASSIDNIDTSSSK